MTMLDRPHGEVDHLLLERVRSGDGSALETLMDRYAGRLYRLAHGFTGNEVDAQEVVQDAFLAAFRETHTSGGRAAVGSWLYRITTDVALVKVRGRRAEREVPLDGHLPEFLSDGHRAGDPAYVNADWSQTPEAELTSHETRAILNQAIDRLPDSYLAVLILCDVEGLSSEEVAATVGDTSAAVKSRLHRARMVLREELTRYLTPSLTAAA